MNKFSNGTVYIGNLMKIENGRSVIFKEKAYLVYDASKNTFYSVENTLNNSIDLINPNLDKGIKEEYESIIKKHQYQVTPSNKEGEIYVDIASLKVVNNPQNREIPENKYLKVVSTPTFANIESDLLSYLNTKVNEIMSFFNLKEIEPIKIYLYDNEEEFRKMTRYPYKLGPLAGAYDYFGAKVYADTQKVTTTELYACISHELIHIIYQNYIQEKGLQNKVVWFDEGLAQNLSGEKNHLLNDETLRTYLSNNVFNQNKVVPNIEYLNKHGNKFGSFIDGDNNTYNGYVWSYLMVRYLIETTSTEKLNQIMRSKEQIKALEREIIQKTYNYFKGKVEVDNHDKMDRRTERRHI